MFGSSISYRGTKNVTDERTDKYENRSPLGLFLCVASPKSVELQEKRTNFVFYTWVGTRIPTSKIRILNFGRNKYRRPLNYCALFGVAWPFIPMIQSNPCPTFENSFEIDRWMQMSILTAQDLAMANVV